MLTRLPQPQALRHLLQLHHPEAQHLAAQLCGAAAARLRRHSGGQALEPVHRPLASSSALLMLVGLRTGTTGQMGRCGMGMSRAAWQHVAWPVPWRG